MFHRVLRACCPSVLAGLLAASASAAAPDFAPLQVLGFSADGRFMAFAFSYSPSESGVTYAEVTLVDVVRNSMVGRAVRAEGEWEADGTTLARARESARGRLEAHGVSFERQGQVLYDLPTSDSDSWSDHSQHCGGAATVVTGSYRFELRTKQMDGTCHPLQASRPLGFRLSFEDASNGAEVVLQDDARIPASRGCPIGYRIRRIVKFEGRVAVFLSACAPGFEGVPTVRHLVVTGSLP